MLAVFTRDLKGKKDVHSNGVEATTPSLRQELMLIWTAACFMNYIHKHEWLLLESS